MGRLECKICGKDYKKITASHLKTHNITYDSYLKEYEKDKYYYKRSAELLDELYITVRKAWQIQDNGDFKCVKAGDNRKWPLSVADLKNHTKGKTTIGVFFPRNKSNVIGFDIDFKNNLDEAREALEDVYKAINTYIPKEAIMTSYSGNKGYHVDIFLTDMLEARKIKEFHKLILKDTGYNKNNIEIRGASRQGYKLPLGIHQKTNNFCYLCNEYGIEIKENESILKALNNINRLSPEVIREVIEINGIVIFTKDDERELQEVIESYKALEIYKNPLEALINSIETKGITEGGTRHKKAFVLGIAYRDKGYCPEEIRSKLIDWHKTLDKDLYSSSWIEIEDDCKGISTDVFNKRYNLPIRDIERQAIIRKKEMDIVLSVKGKAKRRLLYTLINHAKMYADSEGIFYMTYKQINQAMDTNNPRAHLKTQLERLEQDKYIEIVRSNEKKEGSYKKLPNQYKVLNLNTSFSTVSQPVDRKFKVCNIDKRCDDCMNKAICHLYSDIEIKNKLNRRYARTLFHTEPCPVNNITHEGDSNNDLLMVQKTG